MKKNRSIIVLLTASIAGSVYGQIGINTNNPQGVFHVDGAKDNHSTQPPSLEQQMNDVVITKTTAVGIGTSTPDSSALLEIKSLNRGFLPPRITLTSKNDGQTINKPATGLIVYHMGNTTLEAGLYSNTGTPDLPSWNKGGETIINENFGVETYKSPIQPYTNKDASRPILDAGDFQFQVRRDGEGTDTRDEYIYIRFKGNGTRYYSTFDIEGWATSGYYSNAGGRTGATNTFQKINGVSNIGIANELNIVRIYDEDNKKVYRYEVNLVTVDGINYISQVVEVF